MEVKENKEDEPPLLLISHGDHNEKQCFYSVSENRFDTTIIPILCAKEVLGSNYGWLVLVDTNTNDCCLWNPISTETIELPTLNMLYCPNVCILSKPPTEPDCHVLFNSRNGTLIFCRLGDEEFVALENDDEKSIATMESFEGKIYGFVTHGCQLVTIHFVGDTLEFKPFCRIPIASPLWATWYLDYLIRSSHDNELLLVRKMHKNTLVQENCEFRVYQIDMNGKECKEVESIGQRTIFVSFSGVAFCCSSIGTKPNSIYYTRGGWNSRNLYIYDLDEKSTTILLPSPAVRRFRSIAFWVHRKLLRQFTNN